MGFEPTAGMLGRLIEELLKSALALWQTPGMHREVL